MLFKDFKNILAIGAHPDDIEIGCGGFLTKCRSHDLNVTTAIMSKCDNTIPECEIGEREKEYKNATEHIGVNNSLIFDIRDREFPENRIKIMEILTKLQEEINPDLVLIPYLEDPHQDHFTVAHAAIRTFRRNETILQYEILRHGSHTFTPSLFVDISDFLDKKLDALELYKTQIKYKAYFDRESYKSLARTRGAQSGYNYAEGFIVYKMFW
jgi:N-acetylglucosamine malate deacetylase 1